MATYTLDFLFLTSKPGNMPHPPIAHIYVKSSSRTDYGKDKVLIGADCVSPREIAHEIDLLKRDLDEIKKKAIKKYAAAKRAGRG